MDPERFRATVDGGVVGCRPVTSVRLTATISRTLDLRGCVPALTVARTAVAIPRLLSGELVEVLTSDRDSVRDLPVWCRATGNELVEQTEHGGVHRFLIRKR